MNIRIPVFLVLGLFALVALTSFGSAYQDYYGYFGDYFESSSFTSTKSKGFVNGPIFDYTKSFNKISTSGFLDDGSYQKSTIYVKTNTYSPGYAYGYGGYNNYGGYGGYNNYGGYDGYNNYGYNNYGGYGGYNNYGGYGGYGGYNNYGYNSNDYSPWYRKYWF